MNKKFLLISSVILLAIAAIGFYLWNQPEEDQEEQDEIAVRNVVESFGKTLQNVSLLSPTLAQNMEENYKDFLDPLLLAQWQEDPSRAMGRFASSPWPDRIEILNIERFASETYDVSGNIIEVTSLEEVQGGKAAKRPIELGVAKFGDRWLITSLSVGEYEETSSLIYENTQYGFTFTLPGTWREYIMVTDS